MRGTIYSFLGLDSSATQSTQSDSKRSTSALLDQGSHSRIIRRTHPLFLPLLCCRAWMSQTGLRLNWAKGIPTSGLYLQLTVIWMQLMVSSRSTKSGLFWVWALSALDLEGVVLWRLTATAGPVCQILMWHTRLRYPQRENWERGIGSVTKWLRGLRWNVRTVC